MKTCLRLTLFTCLILPTLALAQQLVQVLNSCYEGNAFTIRIPVRFPEYITTVQYAWYRNDTLIEDSHTLLLGEKTIAYTVPAGEAYGSAVYHFRYHLNDGYAAWTASPKYVVNFLPNVDPDCSLVGAESIEGDEVEIPGFGCLMSGAGSIEGDEVVAPDLSCLMSGAGIIEGDEVVAPDLSCLMSGAGIIEGDEVVAPDLSCLMSAAGSIDSD